jgi:hypothetical protein
METFDFTIGSIDTGYATRAVVTVEVEWSPPGDDSDHPATSDGRLSFSAYAKRLRARDIDTGGQMQDELRHVVLEHALDFAPPWDEASVLALLDLWDRWHLNDMRVGCEHQRALGWRSYDAHPSEPCPTCGFKFGTRWLSEPVPDHVLDALRGMHA